MNGIGAHEVIIETPDHRKTLATMSRAGDRAGAVGVPRARGRPEAGSAVPLHPDLQEPRRAGRGHARAPAFAADRAADRARLRARGDRGRAAALPRRRSGASSATSSGRRSAAGRRVIHENADIVALAPYAPRFPFETWLLPRSHGARFEDASRQEYESLARMLKTVLMRMDRALESPAYNLHHPQLAVQRGDERFLPLARRADAEADAHGRLRVGDRLLHQPDVAGGGGAGAQECAGLNEGLRAAAQGSNRRRADLQVRLDVAPGG